MLNLPTLKDLPALPGETPNAPMLTTMLSAADQLPGQKFDSILARTLVDSLMQGNDPEAADPISMIEAPIAAETADTASIAHEPLAEPMFAALAALLVNTIIKAEQAGSDKTSTAVTPSLTDNLSPLAALPQKLAQPALAHAEKADVDNVNQASALVTPSLSENLSSLPPLPQRLSQSALTRAGQTNGPSHIGTMPAAGQAESASLTAYSSHPDQSITTAISADSGKSLPPPTTPAAVVSGPVPPLPSAAPPTAPAAASVPVAAAFNSPAWPDEFGQKITWIATQRLQSAELKLHPAHLGPIEIMLQLSGEQGAQQVSAQFASHHAAVREAIEANLPRLREMMAEGGITLTDTSVSAHTSQQHTENGHHQTSSRQTTHNFSDDSGIQPATRQLSVRHEGLINTFA